ncbi:MAG: transcriptional regulator [Candidatus Bathyarchaeota archaeon]|jgi:predicted transcriptional regulator|nr:transcriptional regulator [Candidatus Bathyarchaeota archaeon]
MARRSQMEILIDILKAVANGKRKPTHIMYRANLSWTRLKKQLDFLEKQELLDNTVTDEGAIFKITPKGKEVLEYFKRIEGELYYKKRTLPTEVYIHYK